jgi:hypothetical protein
VGDAGSTDDMFCIYCGRALCLRAALDPSGPRPGSRPRFEHRQGGAVARVCAARVVDPIHHAEGEPVAVSWLDAIPLEGRQYGVYSNPDF